MFARKMVIITLPETNIAPENRPLEEEIPVGDHHFQVLKMLVLGREKKLQQLGT